MFGTIGKKKNPLVALDMLRQNKIVSPTMWKPKKKQTKKGWIKNSVCYKNVKASIKVQHRTLIRNQLCK